ncbi:uncharacterized protein PITG_17511 [Phytophthora infestans T30-4]|uniref:Uncharacterized protein n=1 Tax=Phytophthora infestans (strain T30-4) TaxID=403677 RepID=D0NWG3_PHYIT|nr:uncharacterized protein PITG_17511 [Phytophthora infestans T30-4]EEY67019.1 conserved hypothetical protein [Phytophthora infestans T30-4]KAI9988212.1 hypothetical protein PInf_024486 [Phytophthora infestans]|eukprot:XP_002896573.1 conserved hypothetical protein [Phytophthora infestans T30-4]
MIEVEGDAAFEAFPGESFRFGVEHVDGVGEIWLENQSSKKRWKCEVTDVEEFAPADVVLPQKTVLHYVAASLRVSAAANAANFGPKLVREDNDETLRLEVLIKLGVADFAWAPKYIFPMSLVARSPPSIEAQAEQITVLTTQVQELQQEVNTLKQQMQTMLKAQATAASAPTRSNVAHSTPPSLPPAPVEPGNVVVMESEATVSTPSRTDKVWSDIIGQSHHKLVQTDEYRETRNPLGMTMRSHRQHTCKVCSVLRSSQLDPMTPKSTETQRVVKSGT